MKSLLESITEHSFQSAIVIRHAERFAIKGNDAHYTTGLTDKGLLDASDFGNALPRHFGGYRLFHSEAKRCRQTAEQICRSLKSAGKDATIAGPSDVIGISYMLADINTAFNESERHGNKFIRTWFDGHLEPGIYMALDETLAQHLDYLRSTLASSPGLDIHVTHDWNINVLREGIFGMKHEEAGWPGYLSGLAFAREPFEAIVENCGSVLKKLL